MVSLGANRCLAFISSCNQPRCKTPGPHPSHGAVNTARKAKAAGIDTRAICLDPVLRALIPDLL
jgi:hypothetical protein